MHILDKKFTTLFITDHSVKFLQASEEKGSVKIENVGKIAIPDGIVKNGVITNIKILSDLLKKLFSDKEPKKVSLIIPESKTFHHISSISRHGNLETSEKSDDLIKLIRKEAIENLPLPEKDLVYSWKKISEDKDWIKILILGCSRSYLHNLSNFLKQSDIDIEIYDTEAMSLFRSISADYPKDPVCIINIEADYAVLDIFGNRGFLYSETIGLKDSDKDGGVAQMLNKDISGAIGFVKKKYNQKVESVIISGENKNTKEVIKYLTSNLKLNITPGKALNDAKSVTYEFMACFGSAIRNFNKKWEKLDPIFLEKEVMTLPAIKRTVKNKRLSKPAPKDESYSLNRKKIASTTEIVEKSVSKKKMYLLFIVIFIGLLLLGGAFWYRNKARSDRELSSKTEVISYNQTQTIAIQIPIAVHKDEYTSDRVQGRTVDTKVNSAGSYKEAVALSRQKIAKEVSEEEIYWNTPISEPVDDQELKFPLTVSWLAFSESSSNEFFIREIDKINIDKNDYHFNYVLLSKVEVTENENIYLIFGDVQISVNELIGEKDLSPEATDMPSEDIEKEVQEENKIYILDTGTGYLNVRSGPGTNFEVKTKVTPGDKYDLIEEKDGWYLISIEEDLSGWVISTYADIK